MKLFLYVLGGMQVFAAVYFIFSCVLRVIEFRRLDEVGIVFFAVAIVFSLFAYGLISAGRRLKKTYIQGASQDGRRPWI